MIFPMTAIFAMISGPLAFAQYPGWTDAVLALLLYFGTPFLPRAQYMCADDYAGSRTDAENLTVAPRTSTSRLVRSYIKRILSNPESRKIFYFLMLNLGYMLVQMLYGVWTNSLGLISDGTSWFLPGYLY